jgi:cation diffusion facilitator CzcD-associated flavoprotein CzcO
MSDTMTLYGGAISSRATEPHWAEATMTTDTPARPGRIDTDALRRKYAEERDKRLRPDGNDQYLRLTGAFARHLDDPCPAAMLAAYEESDFEKMEEIRARTEAIVRDPGTASKLKAWYRQPCKRPCFHDEYLQAFNNQNTHLVDTGGKGVEQITATGVVAAGREYELDCII